ncbi:Fic/DOC family N-terminal domain-containing protein [Geobacillus kaustophilus]|uniref:Fic/DOC family N-terminal domain-containing protein n=1 Tax=Geobacillus kaustophilus TaxID=1462 RepID=UPI0005CD3061|nr:Fic/DOC family N-terminal domain-containing protein [Geobacillus kaustophilus]
MRFLRELIEANKTMVEYQTMLRHSKLHPRFLLTPIMLKEAVQSTKMEGLQKKTSEAHGFNRGMKDGVARQSLIGLLRATIFIFKCRSIIVKRI